MMVNGINNNYMEQGLTDEQLNQLMTGQQSSQQSSDGLTDEQLNHLEYGNNPIMQMVSSTTDQQKKSSIIGATVNVAKNTFDKLSNFFFGTAGKTVGSLVTGAIGSGESLIGQFTGNKSLQQKGDILTKQSSKNITPTNILFTTIETYPGGGALSNALKKLPGGTVVAEGITKYLKGKSASLAEKAIQQYTKIFSPTTKETKAIAEKVVPKLVKGGEVVPSMSKLAEKATQKVEVAGQALEKTIAELPETTKLKIKPITDKLESLKDAYMVEGKVVNQTAVDSINKVSESLSQFGKDLSPQSLQKVKSIFDEHFKVSKGLEDISAYTKKAQLAAANAIRAEFAKNVPNLSKVNAEYSFWKNVQDLAVSKLEKEVGKTNVGSTLLGTATGILEGKGVAGKAGAGIIGGVIGNQLVKVIKSPAWRSFSAVQKNKLADYLAKGNFTAISQIIGRLMAGIKNVGENNQ